MRLKTCIGNYLIVVQIMVIVMRDGVQQADDLDHSSLIPAYDQFNIHEPIQT
jgi:hypothetical protein